MASRVHLQSPDLKRSGRQRGTVCGKKLEPSAYRNGNIAKKFKAFARLLFNQYLHEARLANAPAVETPTKTDDEHIIIGSDRQGLISKIRMLVCIGDATYAIVRAERRSPGKGTVR